MKTMIPLVVLVLLAFVVAPVQGGDDLRALKVYYEKAIDQEIADCQKKSALRASRSQNLRMKGHREASKALFLMTHKVQLVDGMMAAKLAPKDYKVQRYLNDRFSCTCYAQWAQQGNL